VDLGQSPDAATPAPDLAPPPPRYDWVGIVGTGQSLSVGVGAGTVLSKTQPFKNLKLFDSGADPKYPLDGSGKLFLVPLVEPIRPSGLTGYTDQQYPNNIFGETPHTALGNQLSALALATWNREYVTVHSVVGWSGRPIGDLDIVGGKRAYLGTLMEARAIKKLADAAGKTFAYGAVTLTHGEADTANVNYASAVYQLYKDYNTDLKAITGQTENIPMLISQQSTLPSGAGVSVSALAVWQLGITHPQEIICIGPKYQYPYATDFLHMTAGGYRRLGEKNAEVFYQAVMLGVPWHPLQPEKVSRAGTKITVAFAVPVAPLAWEETLSKPHQTQNTQWAAGRGFEVQDSTGPQTISAVSIVDNSVVIELAKAPTGTGLVVRYAMTQDGTGYQGGQEGGRRGQLRDSDPFVGYDSVSANCQVQDGLAMIDCSANAAMVNWVLPRDLAEGTGLAPGTIVASVTAAGKYTLSQPWKGPAGTVQFRHDHRNYAVHFELPVP
jgi:hypothetical protein